MSITRESEKLGAGYIGIVVVFCAGSAIGASLIVFDLVEAWILGVGFGASAITGLGLVRAGDKTNLEILQWLKTRRIAWFWLRTTNHFPTKNVTEGEELRKEMIEWDSSVLCEMLIEVVRNSSYKFLFEDEVAGAEKVPLGLEIIHVPSLSEPFEVNYLSPAEKFFGYLVRDFDVETSVDIMREIIPSMPFHPDLSANLPNNDRADGVYLEFARALFRTKAAKGFFTNSQISEARNRLRETASVGVKEAAAEVTRLIRRPRRRLNTAEGRASDRQEIKRWLAG